MLEQTWPAAGGGMRDCGSGAMTPPHSLQKRANGSVGRGAKQFVHLQQCYDYISTKFFSFEELLEPDTRTNLL